MSETGRGKLIRNLANAKITDGSGLLVQWCRIAAQRWGEDKSALRTLQADNQRLTEENAALREMLSFLRLPLEAALRQARPSSDVPMNVEVYWRTGSDTVAAALKLLDEEEPDHA